MTLPKSFYRSLALFNKAVLPKQWHKDLTRLNKLEKLIVGWRIWVTMRAL
ncbi:MAG: SsrA-binding protein [Flavobacteriales bacterium]|nr:SsrA-binding protein [Flavobacteriales bacterium]